MPVTAHRHRAADNDLADSAASDILPGWIDDPQFEGRGRRPPDGPDQGVLRRRLGRGEARRRSPLLCRPVAVAPNRPQQFCRASEKLRCGEEGHEPAQRVFSKRGRVSISSRTIVSMGPGISTPVACSRAIASTISAGSRRAVVDQHVAGPPDHVRQKRLSARSPLQSVDVKVGVPIVDGRVAERVEMEEVVGHERSP